MQCPDFLVYAPCFWLHCALIVCDSCPLPVSQFGQLEGVLSGLLSELGTELAGALPDAAVSSDALHCASCLFT